MILSLLALGLSIWFVHQKTKSQDLWILLRTQRAECFCHSVHRRQKPAIHGLRLRVWNRSHAVAAQQSLQQQDIQKELDAW